MASKKKHAAPRTPGQIAYEAYRARAGGDSWAELQRYPANVLDWECAAQAVLAHAMETLKTLRASLVQIGQHPRSFWDTSDDVALIDRLLASAHAGERQGDSA